MFPLDVNVPTAEETLYTSVTCLQLCVHNYIKMLMYSHIMFLHTMYEDTEHWKTLNTVTEVTVTAVPRSPTVAGHE